MVARGGWTSSAARRGLPGRRGSGAGAGLSRAGGARAAPGVARAGGLLQSLLGGLLGAQAAGEDMFADNVEPVPQEATTPNCKLATFAGGCFWGLELAFQRVEGVEKTKVGYTQGKAASPTYEAVCSGRTGHTEAVQVEYDPSKVTFEELLAAFFGRIDPTVKNGQGNDFGTQYRTGVYWHDEEQRAAAEGVIMALQKQAPGVPIATEVRPADTFYDAEAYHQQYLAKGGRFGRPQSAEKGCDDTIRCYG